MRFKYHYYNGAKLRNFLGFFLKTFGWTNFAITIIEVCSKDNLNVRENWYLSKYQPILNVLKSSGDEPRQPGTISRLTRSKISETLTGRKDSEITRAKKSVSRKGILNPFYLKGPGIKALDIAAEKAGTKIYVYDITKFSLVNNKPFRSIRSASKVLPISANTLSKKLDTGKPFKGYYYYSKPQNKVPK